jgi:thiol-disulfide isomerase/thioredoxin
MQKNRRRLLLATLGVCATGAGVYTALQTKKHNISHGDHETHSGIHSDNQHLLEEIFWTTRLENIDGTSVTLKQFKNKPLLINFWATWCTPCITEMPLLENFYKENIANGIQLLGIAFDNSEAVKRFTLENGITFPIVLASTNGMGLSVMLGNKANGLPFSVLFAENGRKLTQHEGALNNNILNIWKNKVT